MAVVCLYEGDENTRCIAADAVFAVGLYLDSDAQLWIDDDAGARQQPIPLQQWRREFHPWTVVIPGVGAAESKLKAAIFSMPGFQGMKLRWNLHHLYQQLNLTVHQGKAWVWLAKNAETWQDQLKLLKKQQQ